jgi:hypothetical protein
MCADVFHLMRSAFEPDHVINKLAQTQTQERFQSFFSTAAAADAQHAPAPAPHPHPQHRVKAAPVPVSVPVVIVRKPATNLSSEHMRGKTKKQPGE